MNILDNYLSELFGRKKKMPEFVDPNDPSLPNPYNFRQLKLDPKLTRSDILKANKEWEIIRKKGWSGSDKTLPEIINTLTKTKKGKIYTIIDKNRRVGIIISEGVYIPTLMYVTWVRGKHYATRAIMSFLNLKDTPQFIGKKHEFMTTRIEVNKKNKASDIVAKNLKAKLNSSSATINYYEITAPYWWNNYKLLKT